jgi:hypothetical protein
LSLWFGGWGREEYLHEIVDVIRDLFSNDIYEIARFDRNYGKALMVNETVKAMERNEPGGYMLLLDADIVLDVSCQDMVARLAYIATQSRTFTNKPFGLIAPSQTEGNCHSPKIYDNSYTIPTQQAQQVGAEKIFYPSQPSGIAGGCIFCGFEAWREVGGYRPMGVYAGDDAHLLLDIGQAGYSYQVAADIHVIHPVDHDTEYAKWKMEVCHRASDGRSRSDLSAYIAEADAFWKDR